MEPITVTFKCVRAGQPKAYADSFHEYVMTFGPKWAPGEHEAKRFAAAMRPFKEKDRGHFEGELREWKQIDEQTWRFLVVEAYTD